MLATGIGSLPGADIDAALALVFDTLPDLPFLPELPARGPGADLVGRTAGALVDLHVDLQPSGWRLVSHAGLDERRSRAMLERDLDALVPVAPGYDGRFKVSLCGPWTLSATLELTRGARVAGDAGAVRDLVESCAATVAEHLAEVARRLPAAQLVLQLDEPALPAVLAGRLPTASKLGRVRAVPADTVADGLRHVVAAAGVPVVVHCCAPDVPVGLLATTGVTAVSFDPSAGSLDREALAAAADQGIGLWLGLVPPIEAPATPDRLADAGRRLWHELGVSPARLAADGAVTPSCGLAGATSAGAGTALQLAGQVARILAGVGEEASAR